MAASSRARSETVSRFSPGRRWINVKRGSRAGGTLSIFDNFEPGMKTDTATSPSKSKYTTVLRSNA